MRKIAVVLAVLWGFMRPQAQCSELGWVEVSREKLQVKSVLLNRVSPKIIYMGTDKGIFKSEDAGSSWRNVFSLKGDKRTVNYLTFDQNDNKVIYAATAAGAFLSVNNGQRWQRLFRGKNASESDCTSFVKLAEFMYVGTKSGLFSSNDRGRSWRKVSGKLGNSSIFNITFDPKDIRRIYVASVDGVFKTIDSGSSWEKIFAAHPGENGDEHEYTEDDRDEDERFSSIRYVAIDPDNAVYLYLATTYGIYQSKDSGVSWELLPEYGLLSRSAQFLLPQDDSLLYALTKSGVFKYTKGAWRELSFGLASYRVNYLSLDREALYVGTEQGLFRASLNSLKYEDEGGAYCVYSKGEPTIEEVQKQAVEYAEVSPGKIINWRKKAAQKAVLPQLNVGLGRNTTDLWHWEGGSTTKSDDDTLRRGRDSLDWDVSLSWDFSELIWNNDQTSIDARSRLMVQLRDDILDEVNKTYFERLRVKLELDSLQIEDRKKRFEKELRVRELTASLDALTGGYFSRQITPKQSKYIEKVSS